MQILFSILTELLAVVYSAAALFAPVAGQKLKNRDSENCRLSFAAISDVHITEDGAKDDSQLRMVRLEHGFRDMSVPDVDAVVITGDLTCDAMPEQFANFYKTVRNGLSGPQLINAVGNHDRDTDNPAVAANCTQAFVNSYNEYLTEQNQETIDKPYFTRVINGYTFIVMSGNENCTLGNVSDEQIEWLDEQLAIATADGLPAFVLCHWLINGTNGQENYCPKDGIGEKNDAVEAVLNKYDNVFYISGHAHVGLRGSLSKAIFGGESIEKKDKVWYINLPSYTFLNTEGLKAGYLSYLPLGYGYVVEVYDNSVTFRARSFSLSHWAPVYNRTIELVK